MAKRRRDRAIAAAAPRWLLAALVLATVACRSTTIDRVPLVVLIVVDTLRAESLPSYGYTRATAPFLDRLAAEAVLFENVHSQASCTFPSVNSILTSRYPAEFLAAAAELMGARSDLTTIADVFRLEGYETVAISASPVVRATPSRYAPEGGFGHGFDRFDEGCLLEPAACVTQRALEIVEASAAPLFLYLHYFDPHDPYHPPAEHQRRFTSTEAASSVQEWAAAGLPNRLSEAIDGLTSSLEYDDADVRYLVDLYDEEILYLDGQLERFFTGIEAAGRGDRAVVAVASDHGEQFLEHGRLKHCKSVYEPETRVPLVLVVPDQEPRRVVRAVQNLDITPTLIDAAGLRWRPYDFAGRSLLPLLSGDEVPGGQAYSLQNDQRALSTDRYKILLDSGSTRPRLYDLAADPGETVDLAATEPERFEEMWMQLRQAMARAEGAVGDPIQVSRLLRLAEDRLRTLGYLR